MGASFFVSIADLVCAGKERFPGKASGWFSRTESLFEQKREYETVQGVFRIVFSGILPGTFCLIFQ
ncbi:hypothetical protein [Allobaculum sp. Allo2]|uniref:hypothetical protein n=1 Tax=Allobaculum sp. Allo2 TaxID=2853432 RepID=UPI001F602293|nr:hypothetical protein [Allobaculum sp. Allo2]UNT93876.1 hypothetical protein KWG61_03960 [Allobaculum sp. Allo2]